MKLELALMLADEARGKDAEVQSLHEKALVALADELLPYITPNKMLPAGFHPSDDPRRAAAPILSDDAKRALKDYPSGQPHSGE